MSNYSIRKRKELKDNLFDKYNGRCAYCGSKIHRDDYHIDHIVSKNSFKKDRHSFYALGIDFEGFDNLNPSCYQCNIYKSTYSIEEFREYIERQINRLRKRVPGILLAEKYGLITYNDVEVVFYFEKQKI